MEIPCYLKVFDSVRLYLCIKGTGNMVYHIRRQVIRTRKNPSRTMSYGWLVVPLDSYQPIKQRILFCTPTQLWPRDRSHTWGTSLSDKNWTDPEGSSEILYPLGTPLPLKNWFRRLVTPPREKCNTDLVLPLVVKLYHVSSNQQDMECRVSRENWYSDSEFILDHVSFTSYLLLVGPGSLNQRK